MKIDIVSYDWVRKNHSGLGKVDLLILDEAHKCKNRPTQQAKACLGPLWDRSVKRLLLTGTPCPNGLLDGWSLFNKLDPEEFPNKYHYGWRYCNATRNWFTGGWEFSGANKKRMPELRRKLSAFMVRRRKKDVLPELPPKTFTKIPVSVKGARNFRLDEDKALTALTAVQEAHVSVQRRELGGLKVDAALPIVTDILTSKDRLVLFTYHQEVSDRAMHTLESVDCTPLQITGKTTMKKRHEIVTRFQSDEPQKMVLVAQIEAAGVGINLHAADTCLFLELDWVPARMAQAIDRLHRIGTTAENVHIMYLIAAGTLDSQIIDSLQEKIEAILGAIK